MKLYEYCRLIQYLFLFLISFVGMSMCEVFVVGDDEGWNSGINFATWSLNHNFTKGDFLVFNYVKNVHNVFEVVEETYRSCDVSIGSTLGEYESGNDKIELKEGRKYWFICNVGGHCLGGMRFGIDVKLNNVNSSSNHIPITNPVQSPHDLPNTNNNHASNAMNPLWSYNFICIILFLILFS